MICLFRALNIWTLLIVDNARALNDVSIRPESSKIKKRSGNGSKADLKKYSDNSHNQRSQKFKQKMVNKVIER